MPRLSRIDVGDEIYHCINRSNGRLQIFKNNEDYKLFESLLEEAREITNMRIIAYVVMPNHWHLILQPMNDGDLALFIHALSNKHTRKVHVKTNTIGSGHLYQGRYKSFLVESDKYLINLIKYVERNPVRAKLCKKCEDWKWSSSWRRIYGTKQQKKLISLSPTPLPHGYLKWVNAEDSIEEVERIRKSVDKSVPYGKDTWVDVMINKYHLETTRRDAGRPKIIT